MKMDYEIPDDLHYAESHEWVRRGNADPDEVTIGITDFAQDEVGDVVYLQLPFEGTEVVPGEPCGEIESAKTVSDLYSPVSGEVIAVNEDLEDQPELVNESPYGDGWLIRVRMTASGELEGLLDAAGYLALIQEG